MAGANLCEAGDGGGVADGRFLGYVAAQHVTAVSQRQVVVFGEVRN